MTRCPMTLLVPILLKFHEPFDTGALNPEPTSHGIGIWFHEILKRQIAQRTILYPTRKFKLKVYLLRMK